MLTLPSALVLMVAMGVALWEMAMTTPSMGSVVLLFVIVNAAIPLFGVIVSATITISTCALLCIITVLYRYLGCIGDYQELRVWNNNAASHISGNTKNVGIASRSPPSSIQARFFYSDSSSTVVGKVPANNH